MTLQLSQRCSTPPSPPPAAPAAPPLYLKGNLFIHRKTFKTRPKALDVTKYRLRQSKWFTHRTAWLMEKYALSEEELVSIQRIFSRTDFKVTRNIKTCQRYIRAYIRQGYVRLRTLCGMFRDQQNTYVNSISSSVSTSQRRFFWYSFVWYLD